MRSAANWLRRYKSRSELKLFVGIFLSCRRAGDSKKSWSSNSLLLVVVVFNMHSIDASDTVADAGG